MTFFIFRTSQVLRSGLKFEVLGLCQGLLRLSLQPLPLGRAAGARSAAFCRARASLAISRADLWRAWRRSPEGVRSMGEWFYGILLYTLRNVIEL
ncbi:MAG: hypothetical protein NTX42_11435 [Methanothrix sp.]|nr:hypothetical protein [Methanothrix sp.]